MRKLRVVGYSRVSTLEQCRGGVSLDNQEHKIRAYAQLKDMDLVEMIVEEGKSVKNLKSARVLSLGKFLRGKFPTQSYFKPNWALDTILSF